MSRPEKKKIATDGAANIGGGLFQAFAGLSSSGLPEGVASEPPPEHRREKKPGRVVLRKETAHRGGKAVIVIDGFESHHTEENIAALGKKLRNTCGCGGAVKGRIIEMQGDIAPRIRAILQKEGYVVAGVK